MKTSTLKKPFGCLLFVILLLVIIDCFTDVIETNVIKKIDSTYKTRSETAEEEAKKQAEIAEKEDKRKKSIEKRLAEKLGLKSLYNFGREPEILFLSDKEIYAIVPLEKHGEKILVKTEDGGESWETILAGMEGRYFGRLSVKETNGKKLITLFLDPTGALGTNEAYIAQSENLGKTWTYSNVKGEKKNDKGEKIEPPMKNGKIAVYQ